MKATQHKLRITDLCVGDWVKMGDRPTRICEITTHKDGEDVELAARAVACREDCPKVIHYYHIDLVEPLPITPEILEKNGFLRDQSYTGLNRTPYVLRVGKGPFGKVIVNLMHPTDKRMYPRGVYHELAFPSPMTRKHWMFIPILYVHELQQALRLARIDKDIKL